jgi:hypothetical protein
MVAWNRTDFFRLSSALAPVVTIAGRLFRPGAWIGRLHAAMAKSGGSSFV